MRDLCYIYDCMKSARNTRGSGEPGPVDQRMSREGLFLWTFLRDQSVYCKDQPGSSWFEALSYCEACPSVPLRWEEVAREPDKWTRVNVASAWIPWSGGPRGSRELPASFRVQLPRHTCAHMLALCIYTVHVESRFIYCNVKIYFPFLKDHGNSK